MTMNRRTELLMSAAEALEEGDDPFGADWLSAHDVTSAECINLAQQLAIGARVVAQGLNEPRSPQGMGVMMTMAAAP